MKKTFYFILLILGFGAFYFSEAQGIPSGDSSKTPEELVVYCAKFEPAHQSEINKVYNEHCGWVRPSPESASSHCGACSPGYKSTGAPSCNCIKIDASQEVSPNLQNKKCGVDESEVCSTNDTGLQVCQCVNSQNIISAPVASSGTEEVRISLMKALIQTLLDLVNKLTEALAKALSLENAQKTKTLTSVTTQGSLRIDSMSPISGAIGSKIILKGEFKDATAVILGHVTIDGGFIHNNKIKGISEDKKTITIEIPYEVGCPHCGVGNDGKAPTIKVPLGTSDLYVVGSSGKNDGTIKESNKVKFTVLAENIGTSTSGPKPCSTRVLRVDAQGNMYEECAN